MALWSGRFTEGVSEFTQQFGASLPVDKALYAQDIAGSKAHAHMLAAQGVISQEDCDAIQAGLDRIKERIEAGEFVFDINNEDIHMSIESVLTAEIGDAGARLHTGRSRNDQVATDTRLYAKERCTQLMQANLELRRALVHQAQEHFDVSLPGYTHLQHAQPVLFSHHMLAYVQMLARDYERLAAARDAADDNNFHKRIPHLHLGVLRYTKLRISFYRPRSIGPWYWMIPPILTASLPWLVRKRTA